MRITKESGVSKSGELYSLRFPAPHSLALSSLLPLNSWLPLRLFQSHPLLGCSVGGISSSLELSTRHPDECLKDPLDETKPTVA